MSWVKNAILTSWPTLVISTILFLTVDFCFSLRLLERFSPEEERIEKRYRVSHPVFHHTFVPNYDGIGIWGGKTYRVCTNPFGFRESCEKSKLPTKDYDIAFIGDSFTEGIGLPYEQTFVGQIAAALPNLAVANLGVSSYSPSIYLTKIRHLLNEGFKFKEIVVYIDISDMQDEAIFYAIRNEIVVTLNAGGDIPAYYWYLLKRKVEWAFPLTHRSLRTVKALITNANKLASTKAASYLDKDYDDGRNAWTYNTDSTGYGVIGAKGAIKKSVAIMTELHELLENNKIRLSVGVYPYPAQLLYDREESLQVKIWREFCETRCKHFYNSFPTFFEKVNHYGQMETIDRFFIEGDVHHNYLGSELLAREFLNIYSAHELP